MENLAPGGVTVAPHPVPAARLDAVTVVYLGPLVKDLYNAIHAVHLARIRRVNARLVLAGAGPEWSELCYFAQALKVADGVAFIESIDARRRRELLQQADALLCLEPEDGVSVVVRQALEHGLRVIAPANCGLARDLKEGVQALLVPSTRPSFICEALVTLSRSRRLIPGLLGRA